MPKHCGNCETDLPVTIYARHKTGPLRFCPFCGERVNNAE